MTDLLSLADVTHETFSPAVKQNFTVRWPDVTEDLVLTEVKIGRMDDDPRRKRVPFSLLFLGTTPNLTLNQMIHPMENPALGAMEIFITPLGPDSDSGLMVYQACFN
ncbi:hypothetical protein TSH100_08350 [Azospirillum sp. TSH100]|uniref:DUF6916 family protein n=1 Tax=Azospirillum sp. TSH100 TaxID=652764 RepID=UPI000D61FABC|nr:hypothetical protein [Azospirillum sp. TSH100]PWC88089.1 hypothetical protein TSH100_08350 [Azospirillum sp. TSH100]QCG92171.1 hypothetical protein E6C72_30755 [Azospirillum sp. TSH100]